MSKEGTATGHGDSNSPIGMNSVSVAGRKDSTNRGNRKMHKKPSMKHGQKLKQGIR
jgi:hypothetical protein